MKKKLLILLTFACVACLSAVLLTGCSSSNEEAESSEDTSADISTLIVGFDNSYLPTVLWMRTMSQLVSTWIWLQKLLTAMAGNFSLRLSTGMRRMLC